MTSPFSLISVRGLSTGGNPLIRMGASSKVPASHVYRSLAFLVQRSKRSRTASYIVSRLVAVFLSMTTTEGYPNGTAPRLKLLYLKLIISHKKSGRMKGSSGCFLYDRLC